jgi:rod shape-determining protein MreC
MRSCDDQRPRRTAYTELAVFVALLLISFFTLLLSTQSFIVNFKDLGLTIFSGVRGGIYAVSSFTTRTVLSIKELGELRKEYDNLLKRMENYEEMERTSAEIRQENIRLREQLGFSQSLSYRHMAAQIIGRDPNNLYSALVINRGSKNGIKKDMPVIAYQNGIQGLVGRVIQVGNGESLVMPIYDSSSYVSARLEETRYEGILEGQGNVDTPILMRYIKKQAKDEIRYGDTIITSGMGGIFPAGLSVGRVTKIVVKDYETSIDVEVEPVIDFSRLEYVFVIEKEGIPGNE